METKSHAERGIHQQRTDHLRPGPSSRHSASPPGTPGLRVHAGRRQRRHPEEIIFSDVMKEGIDTTDDSAAAKYFRRMMMANGAYQADSTSERIKAGQERAKAEGRRPEVSSSTLTRPGERVQANVRGEPVGEPRGQDHEDLVEHGQQGNLRWKFGARWNAMTGRSRPVCDCPEPCTCYTRGHGQGLTDCRCSQGDRPA